jgi:phosphoglycerate dehydrogenase-like enzyme
MTRIANAIVTPHKAQSTARKEARTLALICENVRRFKSERRTPEPGGY